MAAVNLTPPPGTGGYLVSEANGYRSREAITVAKGAGKFPAGTVLARLLADAGDQKAGQFVPFVSGAANGAGSFGAIAFEAVDATDQAVKVTGSVRDAEVQRAALVFAGTPNDAAKNVAYTGMAAVGIALR